MTLEQLISHLEQHILDYPGHNRLEVFLECPETGGSWSIEGIGQSGGSLVITLDEFNGPPAPDSMYVFEDTE